MNYPIKTETVHVSDIKSGDCIYMHGDYRTVNNEDIKKDFLGGRIKGQPCSEIGKFPIRYFQRLLFPRFSNGKFVGYFPQN